MPDHRVFTPDADVLGRAALLAGMLCRLQGYARDAKFKALQDCTLFLQAQKLGFTVLTRKYRRVRLSAPARADRPCTLLPRQPVPGCVIPSERQRGISCAARPFLAATPLSGAACSFWSRCGHAPASRFTKFPFGALTCVRLSTDPRRNPSLILPRQNDCSGCRMIGQCCRSIAGNGARVTIDTSAMARVGVRGHCACNAICPDGNDREARRWRTFAAFGSSHRRGLALHRHIEKAYHRIIEGIDLLPRREMASILQDVVSCDPGITSER